MPLSGLPKVRPYVLVGLSAFAIICWLIAVTADMATAESGNVKIHMGVWYTCTRNGNNPAACVYNTDKEIPCGSIKDHFRALQAFLVLLLIVSVPLFVLSILETLHKLAMPGDLKIPGPLGIATSYVVFGGFGILFALIGFAIDFAIPDRKFCGSNAAFSDAPNFGYSASPIFALIAWITMIVVVCTAVLVPGLEDDTTPANKGVVGRGTPNEPGATTGMGMPPQKQQPVQAV